MGAGGRPRGVEEALLGDEHVRLPGHPAAGDVRLGRSDLLERSAEVHGGGSRAAGGAPGRGSRRARSRASRRRARSGTARARGDSDRRGDRPRAPAAGAASRRAARAACRRPRRATPPSCPSRSRRRAIGGTTRGASAICCEPPRGSGQPTAWPSIARISPKEAVARVSSGSIAWAAFPAKSACARSPSKRERARPVAERSALRPKRAMRDGMPWRAGPERCQRPLDDGLVRADERPEQGAPRASVETQPGGGLLERALEHHGAAVVERMRERRGWLDPLDAVLGERHRAHEGRGDPERVDRGAGVVAGTRGGSAPPCAGRRRSCRPARRTSTDRPARASTIAAASPFGPEPTTIASCTPLDATRWSSCRA